MRRKKKREKTIKAWGGFSDGKLYCATIWVYDERRWSIFRTRAEAKRAFEDVRRMKIIVEVE